MPIELVDDDDLRLGDAVMTGVRPIRSDKSVVDLLSYEQLEKLMVDTGLGADELEGAAGVRMQRTILVCPLCSRAACLSLHSFLSVLDTVQLNEALVAYLKGAVLSRTPLDVIFMEVWISQGLPCDRIPSV